MGIVQIAAFNFKGKVGVHCQLEAIPQRRQELQDAIAQCWTHGEAAR